NITLGVGLHGGADAQFINNAVYQPAGDALVIDGSSINDQVKNNILWAQAGHDISVSADNSELNLQSDYNDLYTSGAGVLGQWEGTDFTTRSAWFYQVGLDQHSIVADPQFVNVAGADGVLGYSTATAGPAQIVDDSGSAFSVSGLWTTQANGYGGSEHVSNGGNDDVATWTISNLTPGSWYQVAATWSSGGTSSLAPFTISDGNQMLASPVVDQTSAPSDFSDAGVGWKTLGTFYVTSGTLTITVTHASSSYPNVLADAVRVQAIVGDHGADDNFHLLPSSPAIDAGDPTTPFENEPSPNGGRVNLGNYGNTPAATPTPLQEVQVVSPVGLDKFQVGQTVPITWRTVGVAAPAGYYSGEILADQPLAYYRLGESSGTTAHDASGHALGGSYVNTVTLGANGALMQDADTSLLLPGGSWNSTGGYVQLPSGFADFSNGLTLEVWAYPTSAGNGQALFDLGNGYASDNIVLARDGTTNNLVFQVYDGGKPGNAVRAAGAIQLNVWQHFAVTEDSAGDVTIYKNGQVVASGVTSVPLNVTRTAGYLGKSNFFGDDFAGSLDEAAIYNHVLSAARIQGHVSHAVYGTVNIDLDVGGASVMNIATGVPDSGSFAWSVPTAAIGSGYQIQVHVNDAAQPSGLSHDTFLVANNGHDYYINEGSTTGDVFTTAAGNDANSGKTPDAPMATLRAMLLAYNFQPGDVIHVDTGNYRLYRNILILPQDSGVTIQGPSTTEALLNRGNQNANDDVIDLLGGTHVTLDHLSISGGVNGISASLTANSSYVTISNDDIKSNSQYAIYLDASNDHAVLTGNSVHDNTLRGYPNPPLPAIYVAAADGLIDSNQVFGNAAGIKVVYRGGEADRIVVSNNVVRDNDTIGISGSSDVLITGNNVYNNTTGIYLYNETQRNAGQASQNTVHDNQEGFLTDSFINAYGMSITSNRVYHNSVDGIHLFGRMQAVDNKVYSNPIGILGDTGFGGSAPFSGLVDNNLVYANSNEAIVLNGAVGPQVDNNDLYQPVGDAVDLKGGAKNVQLHNNIAWVLSGYDLNVAADSQSGLKSDYNLFNKGPAANAHVGFYNGATQDAFSDWQTASGLDSHSLFTDPRWVDISGADSVLGYTTANGGYDGGVDDNFYLSAGSPAIDRGYSWPALNSDMLGVGRRDDPGTTNAGGPDYVETQLPSSLYSAGGTPQNSHAGTGGSSFTLSLPFAFPFYDGRYTSVTVSSRGFLEFAGNVDPSDGANSDAKLESSRILAPFWANLRTNASGDDVFVDTSVANQVTIRWQATSVADGSAVSFDVVLFQDGHFRFDYGAGNGNQSPTVGISFGNGQIFVLSRYDAQESLGGAASVEFDLKPGIVDIGAIEFTASSLQTTPPSVAGISPAVIGAGGNTGDPISSLQVTFSEPVNPLDANSAAAYELRKAGSNGFGSPDDVIYTLVPQYLPGSTSVALAISGLPSSGLPVGNYRFTIFSGAGASIHDLAGLGLDGDGNGTPGGNYVRTFSIAPPQADLNASATVDQSTAIEGELLHFTISVDDVAGPQAASQIVVTAPLPAGLTFAADNAPSGTSYDSTTGTWSIANLAKGG
ncbi:MAG TPA: LamG-like jellyroll fold domain-containing protein, partial [Pirellulales bacterium]|nr:LamG-like jellyroll fold domain-containing protein [Pirellulales bacterium]